MTVKSIIDIDVNDRSFQQFNKLWQQYQKQLGQTPLAWQQIGKAQMQGIKGFRELVIEQAAAIGQARMLAQANDAANRLLRSNADVWRDIRRQTASAAISVKDMTVSLMKWTGVVGAVSGLLGAGGLFGVSRLAEGVATGRRGALGIGATYGQQRAFGNAFSRIVDPQAFLSGVEGSLTDVSRRVNLYNAGLRESDLGGGSAAVGSRLINQLKRLADQTPDNLLGNTFRARGLDQFMSEDDFRRLKRTGAGELSNLQRRFRQGSGSYDLSNKDQLAYQNFVTALDDAGNRINTVLVRGLGPLIPGLEKLSNSVVKAIENLTKAIPEDWGEKVGKGIETFAKYLGSEEFQNNVKTFAAGLKWIAEKIMYFGGGAISVATSNPVAGTASALYNSGAAYDLKAQANSDAAHRARGEVMSPYGFWYKPGAGSVAPGIGDLAGKVAGIPGINRFTAFNDNYHKGTNSAHALGRAFDVTISDPAQSAAIADAIRKVMASEGIRGTVIDEYKNPSSRSTAPHIHVQTDVRVMNAAGSSVIVSTQQATPPQ